MSWASAVGNGGGPAEAAATTTAAAEARTRPTASTLTGFHTSRSSRQDSSSALAYSSGGRTMRPMTSGLTRISGVPGWSRGLDLAHLLTEHRIGVESAGHRPLWTQSTPRPKPKGGRQNALRRSMRRKSDPITPLTHHRTSRFLAAP